MVTRKRTPYLVRPPTAVLTRGFDPRLSVGSARPAVSAPISTSSAR